MIWQICWMCRSSNFMDNTGIYHNGVSARQFTCTISIAGHAIHIYLDSGELLIWDIGALHSCHLNGRQLIIKYGNYPHQTLECSGEIADSIYRAWAGNNSIRKAQGFTWKRRQSVVVLLIFLFIGIGFFTLFFFLPWLGEKAANLVPLEAETQLGDRLAEIYTQESETNDSANYYMKEFVKQLSLDDTYKIEVRVIESKEINAFALPGGRIFVYSGIIDKMDAYPELVALLGHEVTHVVNRHSLKSICRSAATSIVLASLFGDVSGITSGLLSQAEEFKQLHYSRELETEADDNGLNILLENQVDPRGMLNLLKLLKAEGAELPQFMKYLSTHPDTDSRISNISANPGIRKEFPENKKLEALFSKLKRHI